MKTFEIMEGAGPFFFEGNKIGILAIHGGGGGTAADLKPLAQELNRRKGFTVKVPLLPGYGTSPEELKITSPQEWKSFLTQEIKHLRSKCEKIIVGGHSMGGVLTLILAAENDLDGIFTISTPMRLKGFAHKLVPIAKIFIKYYSIDSEQFKEDTDGLWVGYKKIPLNIAPKIKALIKEMKESLPKVNCPVICFQGKLDALIKSSSMDKIFNLVASDIKKKIWLENQDHPILKSPDHEIIVKQLIQFIRDYISS